MNKINEIILPKTVVLELTYRCNHHCLFCSCPWYAPYSKYPIGKELNLEQWKDTIDRLYNIGVKHFSISGGECLLKYCMPQVVEYVHEQGLRRGIDSAIVLISIGLAMTEENLRLFKRCNVHLSMSLPGYETFDKHTGVNNADGVLHWFERAKEVGLETTVNVTVTRLNYYELYQTIALGLIHGASNILLNRFLPGGRGLYHINELMLNKSQLNGMLDTAEEILQISRRYGNVGTEIAFCEVEHPEKYERLSIGYKCAAGKGFFVVDPSGLIRTCNHSPHIIVLPFIRQRLTLI
jgi:MoaA/NifB/PqqE/SkfB family radical SAM enzyme